MFVAPRYSCKNIRASSEVVWAPDSSHVRHEVSFLSLLQVLRFIFINLRRLYHQSCEGGSLGPGNPIKLCLDIHP